MPKCVSYTKEQTELLAFTKTRGALPLNLLSAFNFCFKSQILFCIVQRFVLCGGNFIASSKFNLLNNIKLRS